MTCPRCSGMYRTVEDEYGKELVCMICSRPSQPAVVPSAPESPQPFRSFRVEQRRRRSSHPSGHGRRNWTAQEDRLVQELISTNHCAKTVARQIGRSEHAVHCRLSRMGNARYKNWTREEDQLAQDLIATQHTVKAVARQIGRSEHAVRSRLLRMGNTCQGLRRAMANAEAA